VKTEMQQTYPLDWINRLPADVASSLSEVDLLASMRVSEERSTYDVEDEVSF